MFEVNESYPRKYNLLLWDFYVFWCISSTNRYIILHFYEKYVRIKIEDHKILVLVSNLLPKLFEVNTSYPWKYNSMLWNFYVFQCISSIRHIITHFLEKYIRIKIEDRKILALMSKHSQKLDEVNPIYPINIIQSCQTSMYFINLSLDHIIMDFFKIYVKMKSEDHKNTRSNARYFCKYNSIQWNMYFTVFYSFTA